MILPKPGIYAATAYHDENGNGKFDKNRVGLPIEGFGMSNNPTTFLTPPSHNNRHSQSRTAGTKVDILITY